MKHRLLAITALIALAAGGAAGTWYVLKGQQEDSAASAASVTAADALNSGSSIKAVGVDRDIDLEAQDQTEVDPVATDALSEQGHVDGIFTEQDSNALEHGSPELAIAGMLQRIDEHIESGAYGSAVRLLAVIRPSLPSELATVVAFRAGLAAEALGDWATAQQHYDFVVARGPNSALAQLATLGKVRCWNGAGERELAWQSLYRLALNGDSNVASTTEDAWHLLGTVLASEFGGPAADRWSLHEDELFEALPTVTAAQALQAARRASSVGTSDPPASTVQDPAGLVVTQTIGDLPEGLFLRINVQAATLSDLLRQLAKAGGWELRAEESVAARLSLRRQDWRTSDLDAATWLDGVLVGCDLLWRCDQGRLEIVSVDRVTPTELQLYRRSQTRRALQQAVLRAAEHRWTAYTYLAWGRLSAAENHPAEALRLCEQGLLSATRVECDVELLMNIARLQTTLGERDAALQSLYRAVDVRPAHPLHATAYLSIARLQLENAAPARAIPEAMRGMASSGSTPLEPVAACLLASAYLLDGNPHGANAVLMSHRDVLRGSDERDAAALLSALSRVRGTADPEARRRATGQLMEAVAHVDPALQYGHHWWALSIDALELTGLSEEAHRQRRVCLETTPRFPLRDRLLLSTVRNELKQPAETQRPVFELLAGSTDPSLRAEVQWADADVHFRGRQTDAALEACWRLAKSTETPDELRRKALRMMGTIYQQRNDYQSAVMCFAGTLPATRNADSPPTPAATEAFP